MVLGWLEFVMFAVVVVLDLVASVVVVVEPNEKAPAAGLVSDDFVADAVPLNEKPDVAGFFLLSSVFLSAVEVPNEKPVDAGLLNSSGFLAVSVVVDDAAVVPKENPEAGLTAEEAVSACLFAVVAEAAPNENPPEPAVPSFLESAAGVPKENPPELFFSSLVAGLGVELAIPDPNEKPVVEVAAFSGSLLVPVAAGFGVPKENPDEAAAGFAGSVVLVALPNEKPDVANFDGSLG